MNTSHKISFSKTQFSQDNSTHPKIILVGQPNCGKSTIFNKVAGYKSIATNFPGVTVEYTQSHVNISGNTFDLIDLPGTYSLLSLDAAEAETKKLIYNEKLDVIINVVDASLLGRSLELTLELLEFGHPLILNLNMMDEAFRKGIIIDSQKLSSLLKIPVIETIGSQGHGVENLFLTAFKLAKNPQKSIPIKMATPIQNKIENLALQLENDSHFDPTNSSQLFATKLLEKDPYFNSFIPQHSPKLLRSIENTKKSLLESHGLTSDEVISSERHAIAMRTFEKVSQVTSPKQSRRDRIDDFLMHPIWGYGIMAFFLFLFFNIVFKFGAFIEGYIVGILEHDIGELLSDLSTHLFINALLEGLFQGIVGGIAIVIPFLVPFLLGLAIIEDFGYLPRIAFLMDRFMHKIGLHGTAVIPGMLGYGCSVPAIMATRILQSPRDRFIASVVAILVPCAARMTIILGLVGYYLGGTAVFGIYIFNLFVVSLLGTLLAKILPEDTPGMILEMPSYQKPNIKVVFAKTWLRLKDFIVIAWPILIVGSILLSISQWYHFDSLVNTFTRPVTAILGLPDAVGTTLIFGILRKELSLLMLFQALGTTNVNEVLTQTQILVFTLFVVFYIPCVSTLGMLYKEMGLKRTMAATLGTLVIAIVIGLMGRFFGFLVL
jgi:ferrous iron transport protein B